MKRPIAVYPGSFDPVTFGHIDVVNRATELFPKVIVLVARNPSKSPLFSDKERVEMIKEVFNGNKKVGVDVFDGLLVSYAKRKNASVLVRGLRAVSDFEFEFQMALMNRKLDPSIDTVFLMPHARYTYLNSTIVREVARLGGDVSGFVPPTVRRRLQEKLNLRNNSK
ncbi:MAG: pantetheine-phosphate adenylyltransferase [Ignavibacteriae bacterium]|nr:pantetheine-phosphate adenylyltransferase [Ignavibacteriota bacterium]